jgi:hypothetical protein
MKGMPSLIFFAVSGIKDENQSSFLILHDPTFFHFPHLHGFCHFLCLPVSDKIDIDVPPIGIHPTILSLG